ncbi:hypothetical protein [Actinacidiphila acididurans]|uniref:Uncharacterized protein n=1 Tax=Actinacidiphila acididurans TaxID=2784346 RepID=A0ABS2TTY2_9ACTN|nr:hypothetical protein [Actinacidiphila acididurans]MBM9506800.1 hypothetical protein [Actinacidiphila acididurans]
MPDTHKDPLDLHSKPEVLDAQRAADAAWARVEAYRMEVDAARKASAQPPAERGERPVLRPWTQEENDEFARLHAAAVAAGQERRRIVDAAGLTSSFELEHEMRTHSREDPEGAV